MIIDINNWKAYYINLDSRPDRRSHIEDELSKQGVAAERFAGFTDNDGFIFPNFRLGEDAPSISLQGERGCAFSHYAILNKHLNSGSKKILAIFEDDAHFCSDFKERLKYLEDNFNLEWDIFYLSALIKLPYNQKTDIKHVWKVNDDIFTTHAMLINPKSLPKIIKLLNLYAGKYNAIDMLYCSLAPQLNVYCFVPGMVAQDLSSPGDIDNRTKITSFFKKNVGGHVFSEKLEDYNYKKTNKIISWFDLFYLSFLASTARLSGLLGRKIKIYFPGLYKVIKPYFPDY